MECILFSGADFYILIHVEVLLNLPACHHNIKQSFNCKFSMKLEPFGRCPTVGQASAGSNFSPERAKGFTYGIMEFFPSTQEEEEVYSSCEHMAWQDTKLKPVAAILIHADLHVGE